MQKLTIIFSIIFSVVLTACAPKPAPTTESVSPQTLTHIDLGVGFVPNIQFAPFYVAQAKGFYAEEGLDVSLEHGFENDFVALTAQGERQFAIASGDQVILARAQGLPVVYVMKWYEKYPVGVAALADSGIKTPADLNGRTVGIPGRFGASFVAWKGLAYAAGVDETSVNLQEIGFTQAEALSQGTVDAAVVYLANEPVQLTAEGKSVSVIQVSDYLNLVSNGIVTNEKLIAENPELVAKMVRASLKGLQYTIEHPDEAFDLSRQFIPDMTDADAPTQKKVLEASIELWKSDHLGVSDPQAWVDSVTFMHQSGLIETDVNPDEMFTNRFVVGE